MLLIQIIFWSSSFQNLNRSDTVNDYVSAFCIHKLLKSEVLISPQVTSICWFMVHCVCVHVCMHMCAQTCVCVYVCVCLWTSEDSLQRVVLFSHQWDLGMKFRLSGPLASWVFYCPVNIFTSTNWKPLSDTKHFSRNMTYSCQNSQWAWQCQSGNFGSHEMENVVNKGLRARRPGLIIVYSWFCVELWEYGLSWNKMRNLHKTQNSYIKYFNILYLWIVI